MPELSNMVDEAESKAYFENLNPIIPMSDTPAEPSNETFVAEQEPYPIVAADDATPSPTKLPNANTPSFTPSTAAIATLASSPGPESSSRSTVNFTLTVPASVDMPVEAFYGEYQEDASGRRRLYRYTSTPVAESSYFQVISHAPRINSLADMRTPSGDTKELFYKRADDPPEVQKTSDDEPLSASYVRPVNPYSSTTTQHRPSMEEVIGHNWIKFHGGEQPHASLNDSPTQTATGQITAGQGHYAPRHSRRTAFRKKTAKHWREA